MKKQFNINNFYLYLDKDNKNSEMFIAWLGAQRGVRYNGDSTYYGRILGETECDAVPSYFTNRGIEITTLDEWVKIFLPEVEEEEEEDRYAVEMVRAYDGDRYPITECVQISTYAPSYPDEWSHQDDATWCEYNDGYCIHDDASGVLNTDDCFFGDTPDELAYSEYESGYLDTNEDNVRFGYYGASDREDYFLDKYDDAIYYNGSWYRNGDVANDHGLSYNESDDEWESSNEKYNSDYHSLSRGYKASSDAIYTIGFEIEKEDDDAVGIPYHQLHIDTEWCKENDGSLDSSIGYELVSPAFDLFDNGLDNDIKDTRLIQLINGGQSSSCGGHINVASKLFTTTQLFEHLSGYFPLFYAMYEHRLDTGYSKAKKKHRYYDQDKMSSIFIKNNVLEFRIPSAVKSVTNLLWRRDLMRIMCKSIKLVAATKNTEKYYRGRTEVEILSMMLNQNSELYKHLRLVYSQDQLISKAEKFVLYSESYNDKVLPKIIRGNMPKDNLDASNEMGA